jgi:hypothetical protein
MSPACMVAGREMPLSGSSRTRAPAARPTPRRSSLRGAFRTHSPVATTKRHCLLICPRISPFGFAGEWMFT